MSNSTLDRRSFLKRAGLTGGALGLGAVTAGYVPTASPSGTAGVRVEGRVTSNGNGLAEVRVTDGLTVVQTDADGQFSLAANAREPYVYISVPAGYGIPKTETGTALFYKRLNDSPEQSVSFDLDPLPTADSRHAFLVLADPQTQDEYEVGLFHDETVPSVQRTVQALNGVPVFGVGNGDLMFDNLELFPEYERAIDRMGVPFFQVVGNHDLNFDSPAHRGSYETFRDHFGPGHYSFDRGEVHYVVLNNTYWPGKDGFGSDTDSYFGHIDDRQLYWLANDLATVPTHQPVVIFAHIPMLGSLYDRRGEDRPSPRGMTINRAVLYEMLEPFPEAHIIAGHTHENEHRHHANIHEHVVGTVCGAWWSGPITRDGTPNGYAVYEVDGTDILWRYQPSEHAQDYQMRVYAPGADPERPRQVIANVWDADDGWSIVWYEDGVAQGEMEQYLGTDPRSEELHRGDDKPERRTWVQPTPTNHMYAASPSSGTAEITVEATDRFGRIYTETISLT